MFLERCPLCQLFMNQKLLSPAPSPLVKSAFLKPFFFWCTVKTWVDCFRYLKLRNHCIFWIFLYRIYVQTTTAMKLRFASWRLSSGLVMFGSGQLNTSKTSAWRWSCMVVPQLVNFVQCLTTCIHLTSHGIAMLGVQEYNRYPIR